jgi:hypothetical protein
MQQSRLLAPDCVIAAPEQALPNIRAFAARHVCTGNLNDSAAY